MCGIIGILGSSGTSVVPLALKGLQYMEPRGNHSAGIAVFDGKRLDIERAVGPVRNLEQKLKARRHPLKGKTVIGHNRWATHGDPNDEANAHPHCSKSGAFTITHNGTVENYQELRKQLEAEGYKHLSQTDTESIVHLIEREHEKLMRDEIPHFRLERAVGNALEYIKGNDCAFLVQCKLYPGEIVAYRRNRELYIGRNSKHMFVASDPIALAGHVTKVMELPRETVVTLSSGSICVLGVDMPDVEAKMKPIGIKEGEIRLKGYPHFMLQEIFEQEIALERALDGRYSIDPMAVNLEMLTKHQDVWRDAKRIYIASCGTSYRAALLAKLFIESRAQVPVEVFIGSEWDTVKLMVQKDTPIIALSQSGTTADIVDPVSWFKEKIGAPIFCLTNRSASKLFDLAVDGVLLKAGHEQAVPSTKTFTSMVVILLLFAIGLSKLRNKGDVGGDIELLKAFKTLPSVVKETLENAESIKKLALELKGKNQLILQGSGYGYPVALEAELKLQELGYKFAVAKQSGEFKHGPLALVEKGMPVLAIVLPDFDKERTLASLNQVKTYGATLIVVDMSGSPEVRHLADHLISVPRVPAPLAPIIATIPLQLLAYYCGVYDGYDPDNPRNLAKSLVTK